MIQRVWEALSARIGSMHQAAYILALSALLSALLAFLRDRMLAHTFGAGPQLDMYYAAFKVPDLLYISLASLFSAYVLIPALADRESAEQVRLIDGLIAWFSLAIVIVGTLLAFLSPVIMPMLFPQLVGSAGGVSLAMLTSILLLQPIFLGLSNISASVTQYSGRYGIVALAPLVYNAGIIGGIIILLPLYGLPGVVFGAVIGALFHFGIQVPGLWRGGYGRFRSGLVAFSEVLSVVRISLPRTATLALSHVVLFVLTVFAGKLATGSIAVFTFAFNLQAVPLAIIGASYSVAAFPTLARLYAQNEHVRFLVQVISAARHIIFWALPAIALTIILRAHIVRVILGSGAFDWSDTRLTAAALAIFIVTLAAQAMTLLLVRAYYAAGKTYVPLVVSAIAALATVLLGVVAVSTHVGVGGRTFLEILFRVSDVPGSEVLVLPGAFAIGTLTGTVVLMGLFNRYFPGFLGALGRVTWEAASAAGVAGAIAYYVLALLGGIGSATTLVTVFFHGTLAGVAGLIAAGLVYYILGNKELGEILTFAHQRVREMPIASTEETL